MLAEYAENSDTAVLLETMADGALMALGQYSLQNGHWSRYGKLLIALRDLSMHHYDSTLQQLFQREMQHILSLQ